MLDKTKVILIRIFYLLFGLTFSYLFIQTFIQNISANYELNKLIYFGLGIGVFLIWCLIYKLIQKYYDLLSPKQEFFLLLGTFIVFCVIILLVLLFLKMPPEWDYKIVYNQAKSYILTGDRTKLAGSSLYLQYHANNIGLFVFWVVIFGFFNLFGYTDFLTVATLVNAVAIGVSIFLMYLCIRKMLDKKKAYFTLIVSLFFVPIFTYIPIFYTDTISLPFIMLGLYMYLSLNKEKVFCMRNILLFFGIVLVSFLGAKIKMTVWIMLIAILIHFIFTNKLKHIVVMLFALLLLIPSFSFGWQKLVMENKGFNIVVNDYGAIPWQHYLMMGVQRKGEQIDQTRCVGGYNYKDFERTLFYKTSEESKKYNIEEYKHRVKEYGFLGYIEYLTKKAVNAWGEGSYFTDYVYKFDYEAPNTFKKAIRGIDSNWLLYFQQGVSEAMLLIFGLYGIMMAFKKNKIDSKIIIPIAIYGIFIALLFWENRSRYLFNYILIFISLITLFFSEFDRKRILAALGKIIRKKKITNK